MPVYIKILVLMEALWLPLVITALVAAGLLLVHRPQISRRSFFIVIFSFALLGMVTGLLAGFSRTSAMGAVLPAILSLVGGLAIYIVSAGKVDQVLVGTCVIALSLNLLIGSTWGALLRSDFEGGEKSANAGMRDALVEVQVREFRRELGLPESPPRQSLKKDTE
ncbi:MAG: hypothetical protein ABIK82_16735 [Pseudomonadota bacterium]